MRWIVLAVLGTALTLSGTGSATGVEAETLHYTNNVGYEDAPADVGFDLWDVGPDGVDELPEGHKALIWYGGGAWDDCESDVSQAEFEATVDELASNEKVFGWYLWDEVNVGKCGADLVNLLKERANYIRSRTGGAQKSYVVAGGGDGEPVPPELAPSRSGLDLLGLDPYPCRIGEACDYDLIDSAVAQSVENGTPVANLVPTYQAFGQEQCAAGDHKWRMPTTAEMTRMFERWDALVPSPAFDAAYSWNRQGDYACPALVDSAALRSLFTERFAGGGARGRAGGAG